MTKIRALRANGQYRGGLIDLRGFRRDDFWSSAPRNGFVDLVTCMGRPAWATWFSITVPEGGELQPEFDPTVKARLMTSMQAVAWFDAERLPVQKELFERAKRFRNDWLIFRDRDSAQEMLFTLVDESGFHFPAPDRCAPRQIREDWLLLRRLGFVSRSSSGRQSTWFVVDIVEDSAREQFIRWFDEQLLACPSLRPAPTHGDGSIIRNGGSASAPHAAVHPSDSAAEDVITFQAVEKALALLRRDSPQIQSTRAYARAVGVAHTTLSRNRSWVAALSAARAAASKHRGQFPEGSKEDGDLHAITRDLCENCCEESGVRLHHVDGQTIRICETCAERLAKDRD